MGDGEMVILIDRFPSPCGNKMIICPMVALTVLQHWCERKQFWLRGHFLYLVLICLHPPKDRVTLMHGMRLTKRVC